MTEDEAKSCLAGSKKFKVTDYEVFQVIYWRIRFLIWEMISDNFFNLLINLHFQCLPHCYLDVIYKLHY